MPKPPKADSTVRATVRATGYSLQRLYQLLYTDKIPGARKVGREWRIPASAVEELRKRNQGQLAI